MSTPISCYQGTWGQPEEVDLTSPEELSFLEANKGTIIAVTTVALSAIGSLIAGGLLLYLKVNTVAALSLLGGSSGILLLDALIGGITLRRRNLEAEDNTSLITYRVVSWNVGTSNDYSNMRAIYNKMQAGAEFLGAYNEYLTDPPYRASLEEKIERTKLFKEAFLQCDYPDIFCLQESSEMEESGELNTILPEGYSTFTYKDNSSLDCECTIVWNAAKFSKINHADIFYNPEYIPAVNSAPDTIILLKDNDNGTTICVGSAHLRGFSLADDHETKLRRAEPGDRQTKYDLKTMDAVQAHLYIFAGDFNATPEHYRPRFETIWRYDYMSNIHDSDPTIYDANLKEEDGVTPKPAQLDHIYVKGKEGSEVGISSDTLKRTPLNDFNRPSDHLPIGAKISYRPA